LQSAATAYTSHNNYLLQLAASVGVLLLLLLQLAT
jgi:hypothetical protein